MKNLWRKKPVIISALLWNGINVDEMREFVGREDVYIKEGEAMVIPTLEGTMTALFGDFIIRGVQGELYPCKPDIFYATYEKVV